MFDIAWSEFLVVAVVALVVVGPKDLPALLRTVGKTVASLRRMAGEFQSQFNDAMREAELDDLKREVTGLKDAASKLAGPNPFEIARNELKSALEHRPSALAGLSDIPPDFDAPSAFAPQIEPVEEPSPPAAADFAPADAAKAPAVESVKAKGAPRKPKAPPADAKAPAAPKRKPAARKPKSPEPPASGAAS